MSTIAGGSGFAQKALAGQKKPPAVDPNKFTQPHIIAPTAPKSTTPTKPVTTPGKTMTGGTATTPAVDPATQSAYDMLKQTLTSWGLGSLYSNALGFLKQGLSQDEINLKLQDTAEWKTRFAGNAARTAAGLAVLSPAAYIALEEQYNNVARQYGLPAGFMTKATTDKLIGNDVSANELQSRAQDAQDVLYGDPNTLAQWNKYYGASGTGGFVAAILDPTTATPLIHQQVMAAEIGGSAADQGLNVSAARANQFAQQGITLDQARQAYSDIATRASTNQALSSRFGTTVDQTTDENATLLNDAAAKQKQQLLYSEESAQFGGHGAMSNASENAAANI